ncbi:MAG: alpha/beta hydrolase [Deltaproteobacteria bacterium]|nr:alpha/beta hydrolase [Deltaproteobacteria bacterium]
MTRARIETRWIGDPAPGALVFLHEGLGSVAQWRDTPDELARLTGRPALVYSREGYGQSSPVAVPRPLTYMHDEARRIPPVDDPILIGHSDGASIAIIAAGSRAVTPRALVLVAPHVFVEDISVASIAAARDAYEHGDLRARLAKYHADVDGAFWGWNRAWLDPGFRAWNLEAFLPRITAPTLIVQGSADQYGTLAQVEAIERQLGGPHETLIVEGAGHAPFRDQPALVHARIADFVLRHAR